MFCKSWVVIKIVCQKTTGIFAPQCKSHTGKQRYTILLSLSIALSKNTTVSFVMKFFLYNIFLIGIELMQNFFQFLMKLCFGVVPNE